jgi:hypothetical protein
LTGKIFENSIALNYFPTLYQGAEVRILTAPAKDIPRLLTELWANKANKCLGKLFKEPIFNRLSFQYGVLKVIKDEAA